MGTSRSLGCSTTRPVRDRTRHALLGTVLAAVLLGEDGFAGASQERLYVVNGGTDTVSVIDPATGGLAAIPVGDGLRWGGWSGSLAVSPDGAFVYIASSEQDTVWVIDIATLAVAGRIRVGPRPRTVQFTPSGEYAYVTSGSCGTISVVDRLRGRVVKTLALGYRGSVRAFAAGGRRAYAVSESVAAVRIIDTASHAIIDSIPFDDWASWHREAVIASADGQLLYVTRNDRVLLFDTATKALVSAVSVGADIDQFAVAPNAAFAYATGIDRLYVIETYGVSTSLETGTRVKSIAFTPDSTAAYLTTQAGLFIVDTASHSIGGRIPVPPGPNHVIVAPDGVRLYVVHENPWGRERLVSVVDTATRRLVATSQFLTSYLDLAVSPDSSAAYVATDSGLSVIDPVSGTIRAALVDTRPVSIAVTPDGRHAYVTKKGTRTIDILETATNSVSAIIGPIDAGDDQLLYPSHVAFSARGARAYVTYASLNPEAASGAIAVFDTATTGLIATIPVRDPDEIWSNPREIVAGPEGDTAYVTLGPARVALVDLVTASPIELIDIHSDSGVELTLAISPDGSEVYVGHSGELDAGDPPLVAVIDTATGRLSRTIGLAGQAVYDVAFAPDGATAYVTQEHTNPDDSAFTGETGSFISVIDVATGAVSSTIPLAARGTDITVAADGTRLYVLQPDTGEVAVIDMTRRSVVSAFSAGTQPSGLVIAQVGSVASPLPAPSPTPTPPAFSLPDDAPLVVVTDDTGTVSIIDGADIRRATVGGQPTDVAITPDGAFAYVTLRWAPGDANEKMGAVSVVDVTTAATAASIPLGGDPLGVAITPDGTLAYVPLVLDCGAWPCEGAVAVIDTAARAVAATIHFPRPLLCSPAVTPDAAWVYVAEDGLVWVIDTRVSAKGPAIKVSGYVQRIAPSADGRFLYVVHGPHVSKIEHAPGGWHVIPTGVPGEDIITGVSGEDIAVSPDGARAYVTNVSSCTPLLTVIDTASGSITNAVPLAHHARDIALTADGRVAYLATPAGVTVLDTDRLAVRGTFPLENGGSHIALSCRATDCPVPPTPIPRTPPALLPTRTPTPMTPPMGTPDVRSSAWIEVAGIVGGPGRTVGFDAKLRSNGLDVAGIDAVILFPQGVAVGVGPDAGPDCRVNPGIDKNASVFAFWPRGRAPQDHAAIRALVLAFDNVDPIADGAVLFSCRVVISSDVLPGRYALAIQDVVASDGDGNPIDAFGVGGSIVVAESTVGSRPGRVATPSPALESGQVPGFTSSEQADGTDGCQITPRGPSGVGFVLLLAAALPFRRRRQ